MRSKLFVPGSRPEFFAKALASDADALSFDLEDSVVEARKVEAREALRTLLQSEAARASDKTLIVRINSIDSPHFAADIEAVVRSTQPGYWGVTCSGMYPACDPDEGGCNATWSDSLLACNWGTSLPS